MIEHKFDKGPSTWENRQVGVARCVNTERPLTHLLEPGERGLAVDSIPAGFAKVVGQPCVLKGCGKAVTPKSARGYCPRHYQRWLDTGSPVGTRGPSLAQRFFSKVEPADAFDCWLWNASLDQSGYGLFQGGGRMVRSHIWAYRYFIADVPRGLQLDHLCHGTWCDLGIECPHRRCVNPWHLEPVPPAVNTSRGRGARRTHCPQGHLYDPANTYVNPLGRQVCRTCAAASRLRHSERKRAA
jgi:hypothetical protein